MLMQEAISISTSKRQEPIDITKEVSLIAKKSGIKCEYSIQSLTDGLKNTGYIQNIRILRNPTERPKGASNPQICDWGCRVSLENGICHIFAMHSTAAIIISESYDPNICLDLLDALNGLIPQGKWRHDNIDGNADAHIKASILGPSEMIPIKDGKLQLGRWQSPMVVELDGPRTRELIVQITGD